jgi:hypothetical protein
LVIFTAAMYFIGFDKAWRLKMMNMIRSRLPKL